MTRIIYIQRCGGEEAGQSVLLNGPQLEELYCAETRRDLVAKYQLASREDVKNVSVIKHLSVRLSPPRVNNRNSILARRRVLPGLSILLCDAGDCEYVT